MQLGISKVTITPPVGINLAGFGFRDHGSESVRNDLEARIFWFEDASANETACIVTADIIGFGSTLTEGIRKEAAERFGVKPESVFLAASHTHSGPQTVEGLLIAGGPPDAGYLATLQQKLVDAMAQARQNLHTVSVKMGRGKLTGYSINRRVTVDGTTNMAPNPAGVRDDEVSVISFYDTANQAVAALYHFTCHPTVLSDYTITPEYPGAARRYIEQALPGVAAGFLAGCFGDVRPNCTLIGAKWFRGGQPQEVEIFGNALGSEVVRVLQGSLVELSPRLLTRGEVVQLPLAKSPEMVEFNLCRLDLASELSLVGMSGEVCCDYGLFIKALQPDRNLIPVAYANGLIGYIPPERYFPEGGYEPDTAAQVYNLPSPFDPAIEEILKELIRTIMA